MPIDLDTALGAELPSQDFSWTASDVALYALSVGAAADPMDTTGLEYIHDTAPKVLPSFATVAATMNVTEAPRVSFPGVEIDLAKVVHGSQSVRVHRPIPAVGEPRQPDEIARVALERVGGQPAHDAQVVQVRVDQMAGRAVDGGRPVVGHSADSFRRGQGPPGRSRL